MDVFAARDSSQSHNSIRPDASDPLMLQCTELALTFRALRSRTTVRSNDTFSEGPLLWKCDNITCSCRHCVGLLEITTKPKWDQSQNGLARCLPRHHLLGFFLRASRNHCLRSSSARSSWSNHGSLNLSSGIDSSDKSFVGAPSETSMKCSLHTTFWYSLQSAPPQNFFS